MTQTADDSPTRAPADRSGLRFAWLLALAAFLIVFGVRALYIPFALGQDEGDYTTATLQARAGESLYGVQHSARPPVLYAYYGAALAAHDANGIPIDIAIHTLAALVAAVAAALLAFAMARRLGRTPAAFGALLAALLAASPGLQAMDANAETFMLLPYVAAALLMWRWARGETVERPWLEGALAGSLTVLAIMTKQVAGVLLFQAAIALAMRRRDLRPLAVSFLAAAAVATAVTAGWVTLTGQFREWIVFGWLQNFMYAQNAAGPDRLAIAAAALWRLRTIVILPLLLTVGVALWRRSDEPRSVRADRWFAIAFLALSIVPTTISGFFFPHYFIQLIPALALLAALAAGRLLAWRDARGRDTFATAAVVVVLLAVLAGPAFSIAKSIVIYPDLPLPTDQNMKPEVGAWVRDLTKPGDRVLMWSTLRGLNVYADRMPANAVPEASLYTMRSFVIFGPNAGRTILGVKLVEPMDMIIEQWRSHPPDAVLVTTKHPRTFYSLQRNSGLRDDRELYKMLAGYRIVGERAFGGYDAVLYVRK